MGELEAVVRRFYHLVSTADYAGVENLCAEDVVWTIPGPSSIPYAGTFRGRDGVREFFRILEKHERLHSFLADEVIADEARGIVCVTGSEIATAIATGRTFSSRWAEIFRIRDGLIAVFEEHIDTQALAAAYRSEA